MIARASSTLNHTGGTLTIDGGTFDNGGGALTVSAAGAPRMDFLNGATATQSTLNIGSTAEGRVEIDGAGSQLDITGSVLVGEDVGADGRLGVGVSAVLNIGDDLLLGNAGGDALTTISNGGTVNVVDQTFVGRVTGGASTLNLASGGVLNGQGRVRIGVSGGSEGHLNLTGSGTALNIGQVSGFGGVWVGASGLGTLSVSDSASVTLAEEIEVGKSSGGDGTITVSGGGTIYTPSSMTVGLADKGVVNITDGMITTDSSVTIGGDAGSSGQVLVTGSSSSLASGLRLWVGDSGTGTLTVKSGGTVTVGDELILGHEATGDGTLDLQGGTMNVNDNAFVGFRGTGKLDVSSGSQLDIGGHVFISDEGSSTGDVTVDDGTLNVTGSDKDVYVGDGSTGMATLVVVNGGVANFSDDLRVGHGSVAKGIVTVGGSGAPATLDVSGITYVGINGEGDLNLLDGGSISATTLNVANNTGSNGQVTVNGASASLVASSMDVGGSSVGQGGTGTLTINSGNANVANALKIWSGGTVNLSGGRLEAATIDHTGGGSFTFNGGELNVGTFNGSLVNNGGSVSIGNSPGVMQVNGDYTQNSGTLEIELGGTAPGTEFDQLNVSGNLILGFNSTLEVSLIDLGSGVFEPQSGDSFEIITMGTPHPDPFNTVNLPALRGGLSMQVQYDYTANANTINLNVLGTFGDVDADDIDALAAADAAGGPYNPLYDLDGNGLIAFAVSASGISSDSDFLIRTILGTEYGDANLDGKIDIIDLDLLGQDFNNASAAVGGWLFGDFDGSGITDITDLDLLGQNYGFVAATASGIPVPEPTTWSLICMVAGLLVMRRRGRFALLGKFSIRRGGPAVAPVGYLRVCTIAVLLCSTTASARADLVQVETDPLDRATVTVTPTAIPAVGFITYTFSVEPFLASQEVTSIDASFSATTMRQVNPSAAVTVFTDFNIFFAGEGEDVSGIGDSQFHFPGLDPSLLVAVQSESPISLSAAFTGFTPIQTTSTFGHVVLPVGDFGTFDFGIVVRDDGVLGAGDTATFSSVSFGGLTAVPEASTVLVWSLLTVGAGIGAIRRRRKEKSTARGVA